MTWQELFAQYEKEIPGIPTWRGIERNTTFQTWLVSKYGELEQKYNEAVSATVGKILDLEPSYLDIPEEQRSDPQEWMAEWRRRIVAVEYRTRGADGVQ